ncbi:MAG: FtsW/RodA/SpoVE family cell cycle protein [Planctomycetes bacterium]|nr:FtsW/RodA/SpoVE family cell cycle protein [Planctomycetota bacterium]
MKPALLAARIPWSMVVAAMLLMAAGCVAIHRAEVLSEAGGHLVRQQMMWMVLAVISMIVFALPSYRLLLRYSYAALAVAIVLLVAVYFTTPINGAHRWLRLGPIGVQPSDLAKLALVMALARWLTYRDNSLRLSGLIVPLLLTLAPMALILREPDLGTALVLPPVTAAMLLAAGARPRHLAVVGLLAALAAPLLWTEMSREQKSRVTAMLTPSRATDDPTDDQFHLHRAKQTLSVGGVWGSWLRERRGETIPADDAPATFLVPAPATDSIACIVAERFGLWGLGLLLSFYAILVGRGLAVARATQEPYGRLLCVGFISLIAVQVLINTAMMVGLLPITGISLPLVSYGGSGLLASAAALGLILNIAARPGFEVAGEPFRVVEVRKAA